MQILRINHKKESLSTRLRFKAARVDSEFLCFVNLEVRPFEGGEENDEELYVGKGDGWNYNYWHWNIVGIQQTLQLNTASFPNMRDNRKSTGQSIISNSIKSHQSDMIQGAARVACVNYLAAP